MARSVSEEEIIVTSPPSPAIENDADLSTSDDEYPLEDICLEKRNSHDQESAALLPEHEGSLPRSPRGKDSRSTRSLPWTSFLRPFALGMLFGTLILTGIGWWWNRRGHSAQQPQNPQQLEVLSNGTHTFRRTVLMVSLDGLRADYLDRNLTTHLHDISVKGLRAKFMQPVFPSLTFPNHWSLMTGLYAESHGIVANTFYDPLSGSTFLYSHPEMSWNASWWGGEPAWASAEKAGLKTANLMWPGPPVTSDGMSPTYYIPFKDHVELQWKHDQIFQWLDLPFGDRPQLITAYEPSVDQIGHKYGPSAPEVDDALKAVDLFARSIHRSLAARNLTHIVDVIFVSDHGMVDTSELRLVYVDDVLGKEGWESIEHNDGWPSYGLRFAPRTNITDMLVRLYTAAASYSPPAFDVYVTHEFYASMGSTTLGGHQVKPMPKRYHYSNNVRIAPIYVVPRLGWALTNRHEHLVVMNGKYEPRGNHGYDPEEPSMHAIFVADGPFSASTKAKHKSPLSDPTQPLVLKGFKNVEVYGLVAKLLGYQGVQTNGTAGFWDQWVG